MKPSYCGRNRSLSIKYTSVLCLQQLSSEFEYATYSVIQEEMDYILVKDAIEPLTDGAGFYTNVLWFISILVVMTHTESLAVQSLHAHTYL